jgi:ribosome-associated protein
MSDSDHEDSSPERPSKSLRKREMTNLQKLGEELVLLSETELAKIPLTDTIQDAIAHARTLTSHLAKRRQLQFIGRLMRHIDPTPIEQALEKIKAKGNEVKIVFHQTERWRDKLIAKGDEELNEFLTHYPHADRQQLRQLVRLAQQTKPGADTALFRFLRQIIERE